jgi:hypothetical protein
MRQMTACEFISEPKEWLHEACRTTLGELPHYKKDPSYANTTRRQSFLFTILLFLILEE